MRIKATPVITAAMAGLMLMCSGCRSTAADEFADAMAAIQQKRTQARSLNERGLEQDGLEPRQRLFTEAVAKDPMFAQAHNNLGVVLAEQGQFYQAALHLQQASELSSESAAPLANLAVLHAQLFQWDEALQHARLARDRQPNSLSALRVLAVAALAVQSEEEDVNAMLKKLVLMDQDPQWRQWANEQLQRRRDDRPVWQE
jgi:tetratricopeptide (TPR) repeat protein